MPRFLGGRFLTGEFSTKAHCKCRPVILSIFRLWYFMCFYFCEIFPCGVGAASITRCLSWIFEFFVSSLVLVYSQAQRCSYISYYVGQIAATGMMVPTGRWQNEMSWRLPLWIQVSPRVGCFVSPTAEVNYRVFLLY